MRTSLKGIVLAGLAAATTVPASALSIYFSAHDFNIAPTDPTMAFAARWHWGYDAAARDTSPANQRSANSGMGPIVGPGGGPFGGFQSGTAVVPWADSYADTEGRLGVLGVGMPLTGGTSVFGWADVYPPQGQGARASATSYSFFDAAAGNFRRGRVEWNPRFRARVGESRGSTHEQRGRIGDPFSYRFFDPHEGWVFGELFRLDLELLGDNGIEQNVAWENGILHVDARHADFNLVLGDRHSLQRGTASFQIRNGLVTAASDSGMFSGLMPSVGSSGAFDVTFGSIAMDLDFGPDATDTSFHMHGDGEAYEEIQAVPEPSTLFALATGVGLWMRRRARRR